MDLHVFFMVSPAFPCFSQPLYLSGALPAARELLAHGTQSVRRSAVAVADLRPAAAERHLALLGDEDATLRCQAVEALQRERLRPPERARLMRLGEEGSPCFDVRFLMVWDGFGVVFGWFWADS